MAGTLLKGAYQTPQKGHKVPKKMGERATTGGTHTQVGELDDEIKEPSPAMKAKEMAKHEKLHATRRWVSGEISNAQHTQVHKRANHVLKNAHKIMKGK